MNSVMNNPDIVKLIIFPRRMSSFFFPTDWFMDDKTSRKNIANVFVNTSEGINSTKIYYRDPT